MLANRFNPWLCAIGLLASFALTRVMSSMLYREALEIS